MPTVLDLSAPYQNHLRPVLAGARGVCGVCHTSVAGGYPLCYQCMTARSRLAVTADAVGFTALAVKDEQLARELWAYKNGRADIRPRTQLGLAAVLWRSLAQHEVCLAAAASVSGFSVVTAVPSSSGRPDEPVAALAGMVGIARDRYRRLLEANAGVPNARDPRKDRFVPLDRLQGESVLLLDDTWTTGAHAQSAVAALHVAGAGAVAVWALGRHFRRDQAAEHGEAAEVYYRRSRAIGWNWDYCCLCDPRRPDPGSV